MATQKQKQAVANIVENHGNVSKAMRDAGYPPVTAKNPKNLTESKGYKEIAKPFVDQLEDSIQNAMDLLPTIIDKASYAELVTAVEKMKKLQQLLGGEATDNIKVIGDIDTSKLTPEQCREIIKNAAT